MSSSGTLPQTLSGTIPTDSDYAEMARRPLAAEQCALIVVDMQNDFADPGFQPLSFSMGPVTVAGNGASATVTRMSPRHSPGA